jgi:hypothetical protein
MHQDFKFDRIADIVKSKATNNKSIQLYKSCINVCHKDRSITPTLFWTSGTDRGCESFYGYCTTKRLVREEAMYII